MTFTNIFDSGAGEARSAEDSAQNIHGRIPGVRPEREGVDPELFEDIPETARDPKIIRETSPEALNIMGSFITPLFRNTQTAAARQREASESPASTTGMASSTKDEAFTKVEVSIGDEDQPSISAEEREELSKDSYASAKKREKD
ncbi:hypothetical protein AB0I72_05655 [Nocardiopsis sp. NPDC049922]|uniref:hypothetical protein n=1 Tax=Nocardiopsis sp. NPDC049922 TaxID=3155157 RepID=UPI0033DFF476